MTRMLPVLVASALLACSSPSGPDLPDAELRVLFVGNSLTAANDLPGLVRTIARAAGRSVETLGIVAPNYALEDHWRAGVPERIRALRPDVVVFQQGPSSLRESRLNLLAWTDSFAPVVREAGATPAFLMVWPEVQRAHVFDDVRDNYRAAAERAQGLFLPAGEAWRPLVGALGGSLADEGPDPYGPDGFHPSFGGSVLAAYVVVRVLCGAPVGGLPADMVPSDGRAPEIHLDPTVAARLQHLADSTVAAWHRVP